jgi:hypothetical protein
MNRLRNTLTLAAILPLAACYSYQTIPVDDVRPDLPVHLRVKPEAAEHLAQVAGYPTQDVDGRVISLERDTILLRVRSPLTAPANPDQQLYQRLDVPVSQLIEVQQRHLNRTKTYASVAVAAAGAGALAIWVFTASNLFGSQSTPLVINNAVAPAGLLPHQGVRLPLGRLRLGP